MSITAVPIAVSYPISVTVVGNTGAVVIEGTLHEGVEAFPFLDAENADRLYIAVDSVGYEGDVWARLTTLAQEALASPLERYASVGLGGGATMSVSVGDPVSGEGFRTDPRPANNAWLVHIDCLDGAHWDFADEDDFDAFVGQVDNVVADADLPAGVAPSAQLAAMVVRLRMLETSDEHGELLDVAHDNDGRVIATRTYVGVAGNVAAIAEAA